MTSANIDQPAADSPLDVPAHGYGTPAQRADAVGRAAARVDALAEKACRNWQHGREQHRASGRELWPDNNYSPRFAAIWTLMRPESRSAIREDIPLLDCKHLLPFDRAISRIGNDIVINPAWITREHFDRSVTELGARADENTLRKQAATRLVLEGLEQPFRAALLERHIAESALAGDRVPAHLKAMSVGQRLTYEGDLTIGIFSFPHFWSKQARPYLVDELRLKNTLRALALVPGDVVTLQNSELGRPRLDVAQRASSWTRDAPLEGRITAIHRTGEPIGALWVQCTATGQSKWLRPAVGNDIAHELSPAGRRALSVGAPLRIDNGALRVGPEISRAMSCAHARAR